MNPAQLLAQFSRISDAPHAIPRLRRFIFELAVRGKLVEQDPRDEPASELLKRIQEEKAQLAKEEKIRKQHSLLQIEPYQVPFDIPAKWEWTRLGEIGLTQTGTTPSKNHGDHFGSHIPFIKPGDLYPNNVDYTNVGLSETGLRESGRIASVGSLLMVCIGTIGKCQLINRDCSFNQQINSLSPYGGLCSRYLLAACLSEYFQKSAWAASARTTIAILNKGKWELLLLPLPPLAEQQRIVAKVDELMALCDRLETAQAERENRRDRLVASSLHRLNNGADPDAFRDHARFYLNHLPRLTTKLEHIQQLRQTILNLAVRGKFVPQDPKDESASELLQRIQLEKVRLAKYGSLKKDKTAWIGLPAEPPHQLPHRWRWTRIQDLFEISRGGSPRPAGDPRYFGGPIPWITVREITKDGNKYLTSTESSLTEEGATRSRFIDPGDLLLTNSGATLGVPKISRIRACMNDGVAVLRLFHSVPLNDFAYFYLHSQTHVFRQVNQGMGQPNLNTPIIAGWFFPLPPLAEQKRIVAKVEELMALCDRLEAQLTTTQTESRRLLEAVLHEALCPVLEKTA